MATTVAGANLETGERGAKANSNDVDWLVPFAIIVAAEILIAQTIELSLTYSLLALTGAGALAIGWLLLWVVRSFRAGLDRPIATLTNILWANRTRLLCTVIGIEIAAFGISAFSVLKAQMTTVVPFYADHALAEIDVSLFGQDGWRWSKEHFGFLFYPINLIYSAWLVTHFAAFTVMFMSKPSHLKAQAIIACGLMWLLLGIFLAYACSSAGPIFYDRLYGGQRFAELNELVRPTFADGAANYLWARHVTGDISVGGGISAMPSLHVAGTLWLALIVRRAWPRWAFIGWAYLAIIYLGSVMLGWHYATDGLVGMAGMLVVWRLAGQIGGWRSQSALVRVDAPARARG